MGLNSVGIWEYDEGETAAPFSTVLNRLSDSVTDTVGGFVGLSNVTTITNAPGSTVVSGSPCQVARIGAFFFAWGRWTRTASTATQTWGTIPGTLFNPPRVIEVGDYFGAMTRVYIQTDGTINTTGTPTGSSTLSFQAIWPAISL